VQGISLTDYSKAQIQKSIDELKAERETVQTLGII
jgi:hypothetical protein